MKSLLFSGLRIAAGSAILMLVLTAFLFGCTNSSLGKVETAPIPAITASVKSEEGTVEIVSNGEVLRPYKSRSHGAHSGLSADDFEVKIEGNPLYVNYMT